MFIRALIAFLVLPGVIGGLVPGFALRPGSAAIDPGGLIPLAVGTALLLWCVRDFYVVGRGTLAPWAPPTRLVIRRLYRISRNPMYVGVLTVIAGWAVLYRSYAIAAYGLLVGVAFHLRVRLYEERVLARLFPDDWARYRTMVPRWIIGGIAVSPRPGLPWPLAALIVVLCLSTVSGIYTLVWQHDAFAAAFTGTTSVTDAAYLVTALALLVGLGALASRRPWALAWLGLVTLAAITLDVCAGAPTLHLVATGISLALLAAAAWPIRSAFRPFLQS